MALCPINHYHNAVIGSERLDLEQMSSRNRQLQFGSGRQCIRTCQALLELEVFAIPRVGRVPQWPAPFLGSISHSRDFACGVLSESLRAVGVDIEQLGRVDRNRKNLLQNLFTPRELNHIGSFADDRLWTIAFGAKEAAYKAVYSKNQDYIGFQEVDIRLSPGERRFSLEYLGDKVANRLMNLGTGYWLEFDDHCLSLFVIE